MVKKIKNKNVKIVISILQSYPLLNLSQFWEHGIEGPYLSKKIARINTEKPNIKIVISM